MRHGDRGAPKIRYRWNLALHRFAGAALASVCDGGLIRGGSPMKIELNHVLHLANATSTLPVSSSLALGCSLGTEVVWPALVTGLVATSAMTLRDPRARKPTFEESGREEATRQVACDSECDCALQAPPL